MTMHRLGFYPFGLAQAFPVIADQVGTNLGTTFTPVINLPSSIAAGELLLAHIVIADRPDEKCLTWPDGWIALPQTAGSTTGIHSAFRRATGGETTVTPVYTNNGPARQCIAVAQRITGAHATIPPELIQLGDQVGSANPVDPPNNAPSWGSAKTLFVALVGAEGVRSVSTWPTNYTLNQFTYAPTQSTIASAARELQAASDDPSAYTLSSTTPTNPRTIAIPPAGITNGYPDITGCRTTTTGSGTSHVVNMPAGIVAGEMLLWFVAGGAAAPLALPTGWTALWPSHNNGSGSMSAAFYRIATGSESATYTLSTSPTSTRCVSHVFRISGSHASAAPEVAAAPVTGSSTIPNPPSLTPSWGSANTLWFNYVNRPVSFDSTLNPPIEYTHGCQVTEEGNASRVLGVVARRAQVASEDPTTWLTSSGAWTANTFAVRPA